MQSVIIVYLPGYGGNFLRSIFSLDPCTVPCLKQYPIDDTPNSRADLYTLVKEPLIQHFGDIINQELPAEPNFAQSTVHIRALHPYEFFQSDIDSETQVFLVDLDWSNFSNYWLIQSKSDFNYQFAKLRPNEIFQNLRLYRKHEVIHINLNSILDKQLWYAEYQRINSVMGLSNHPEAASRVYEFWYDLRVTRYVEGFKNLSQAEYARFCRARLEEEIWGSPTQWQVFYERVRDPSWPDCPTEKDFHNLPDIIQKELITAFNYQPPIPI